MLTIPQGSDLQSVRSRLSPSTGHQDPGVRYGESRPGSQRRGGRVVHLEVEGEERGGSMNSIMTELVRLENDVFGAAGVMG